MLKGLVSNQRYAVFLGFGVAAFAALGGGLLYSNWLLVVAVTCGALFLLGIHDLRQDRHATLRNCPVVGHLRFLLESIRPEIRQYIIESDNDAVPFNRQERGLVYQRAKGVEDKRPFGTIENVYGSGYAWLTHSAAPVTIADTNFRVRIGGSECKQPYDASIYNISAMSFGSLSASAILALNTGARKGGFAHDTGEGSISRYHRQGGGDLIYQVASGYFGCRDEDAADFSRPHLAFKKADEIRLVAGYALGSDRAAQQGNRIVTVERCAQFSRQKVRRAHRKASRKVTVSAGGSDIRLSGASAPNSALWRWLRPIAAAPTMAARGPS